MNKSIEISKEGFEKKNQIDSSTISPNRKLATTDSQNDDDTVKWKIDNKSSDVFEIKSNKDIYSSDSSEYILNDIKPFKNYDQLIDLPKIKPLEFKILNENVTLFEGENLATFLRRYPYSKNKNNVLLSSSSNRLKYLNEKRYSNFLRNLFYCYKNIKAIEILDDRYKEKLIKFLQTPSKYKAKQLIDAINYYREFFTIKPTTYKALKFVDTLNSILGDQKRFVDSIEAIDFWFKPLRYIYNYLNQFEVQKKNEKPVVEMQPESIIHDLNIEEFKNPLSGKLSDKLNASVKSSIYDYRENKKRHLKYKNKLYYK